MYVYTYLCICLYIHIYIYVYLYNIQGNTLHARTRQTPNELNGDAFLFMRCYVTCCNGLYYNVMYHNIVYNVQ